MYVCTACKSQHPRPVKRCGVQWEGGQCAGVVLPEPKAA